MGRELNRRLEGTLYEKVERLEKEYLSDFVNFYDFVIRNHDQIQFGDKETIFTDEDTSKNYDDLKSKYVSSADKFISFYEDNFITYEKKLNTTDLLKELDGTYR